MTFMLSCHILLQHHALELCNQLSRAGQQVQCMQHHVMPQAEHPETVKQQA